MSTADNLPNLTPNEILVLVVLMAEARELDNNELKELAGFSLTGGSNTKLEQKEGLVATDRSHRPFSHQLTDKGWHVMRQLHTSPPPKAGGSAIRSLFTVLSNVNRSLDRLRISHGEFFKQSATAVVDTPAVESPADGDTEAMIRAAYRELAPKPGEWVGLADLRDRLASADRTAVDDALIALAQRPGVRLIPIANAKSLQDRDRAAAVTMGGEDRHALSIGPA